MAFLSVALPAATMSLLNSPARAGVIPTAQALATPHLAGANDWSCRPTAAHPFPVVLVHGTYATGTEWRTFASDLHRLGYCVFALDYGSGPVWLRPFFGSNGATAPIERSADQLAVFVKGVLAATGTRKIDIVGHSQGGGVMPRYYLKFGGGAARVHSLVALSPNNRGTTLNGVALVAAGSPGIDRLVYAADPAAAQQIIGSPILDKVNAGGVTVTGISYTVIATARDKVITPYSSQFLTGPRAHNVTVQGLCAGDRASHAGMPTDPVALHEAENALDPATATPTTCGSRP